MGILADNLAEPFEVDNDTNLSALGQAWRGAGRGVHSFVTMSLGTGIGGGVVIDGHLISGRHNAAGEVGLLAGRQQARTRRATATASRKWRPARPFGGRRRNSSSPGTRSSLPADFSVSDIFAAAASR